ncbi:unnamed protein product [Phytophthora fragariaefolia]|uniref:Unnamed protein product n=1 Tax=Phytophthora fragariaefolia TaxID=1490495 RepID=A0A9W7CKE6_9STRA|nr:unnamed protein product [Phytophthora fragariaefolia]
MDRFGLRFGVLLGGLLQAAGASLRYFACAFDPDEEVYATVLGQVLASFAMPFMVNSPAVLSANWFPLSMRATATSVAVSANALGTALVYLVAPFVVFSSKEVPEYNFAMAVLAGGAWTFALLFFWSFPNARHDHPKSHHGEDYDWSQWINAFKHNGFWHTVVAHSLAECVLNTMCALLTKLLSFTSFSTAQIGVFGAVFIISSLVGSQVISGFVDERRNHKVAMQICLVLIAVGIALFRLVPKNQAHATLLSLLFLGFVVGPVQPIVLELGVECAFPTSAATVAALQQLSGNVLSAIVVPTLSALLRTHLSATGVETTTKVYSSPEWILIIMTTATFIIFCFLYEFFLTV